MTEATTANSDLWFRQTPQNMRCDCLGLVVIPANTAHLRPQAFEQAWTELHEAVGRFSGISVEHGKVWTSLMSHVYTIQSIMSK